MFIIKPIIYNGVMIDPIKLNGIWKLGYALDMHILSSEYLGVDENGHERYETTRTAIGEMVYQIKYGGSEDLITPAAEIASQAIKKLILLENKIDCIIPIPPSLEHRQRQPVIQIAEKIAVSLNLDFNERMIYKSTVTPQMKNIPVQLRDGMLENVFHCDAAIKKYKSVLLFDDLFQSGTTVSGCAEAVKAVNEDINIFLITLTKTRR